MNSGDETTTDDFAEFSDDLRAQELQSCRYIYPDCEIDLSSLSGTVNIKVKSDKDITIHLLEKTSEGTRHIATSKISNLSPIVLSFQLNSDYPFEAPPEIKVACAWIATSKIDMLTNSLYNIWKEYKDQVLFNLIDHLQDQVQNHLDELIPTPLDIFDMEEYYNLVDFNIQAEIEEFNLQTYTCDICQKARSGVNCTKFDECGHVFCNNCLAEYFESCVESGDIDKVHCPDFECTKKYLDKKKKFMELETWMYNDKKVKDMLNQVLIPSTPLTMLTKILSNPSLVDRYYSLFKKNQYEWIGNLLPNRLVKCPRIGCEEVIFREDIDEKLVVCPKCKYAFCNDCRKSYHARFKLCLKIDESGKYLGIPIEDLETYPLLPPDSYDKKTMNAKYGRKRIARAIEEYQMDQLFQQMLRERKTVVQCPGCSVATEKSEGCNKMKCSLCKTDFCFNCGSKIENNHDHFVDPSSPCYKLLFFGMPGTEDIY